MKRNRYYVLVERGVVITANPSAADFVRREGLWWQN